jgi:uncharacterized membrane protein
MNWHSQHIENRTLGERLADNVAAFVGSWRFIFIQSMLMLLWVVGNIYMIFHFDPYPFIFLNLFMSAEAAFSTPIIMMSQNRQSDRDRHQAEADYQTNLEAEKRIEDLQKSIANIEITYLQELLNKK